MLFVPSSVGRAIVPALTLCTSLLVGCTSDTESGSSGDATDGLPLALAQSIRVDGFVDFNTLDNVQSAQLEFSSQDGWGPPTGKRATLKWAVRNDDHDLYVAMEWDDSTHNNVYELDSGPMEFDGVRVLFDEDGDGFYEAGEDARTVIAATVSSRYVDQHASRTRTTDTVANGVARLRWDSTRQRYQAEFLFPLSSDSLGEDGALTSASRFNIVLLDHIEAESRTGNATGLNGLGEIGETTDSWVPLELENRGPHKRRKLPQDLEGLLVFSSTHESEEPEIYTHDPATGVTTRVTYQPNFYKDGLSLSHDRTRIAYYGAANREDFESYEIYVVNVEGGEPLQLTHNELLDGHPGWSPHDDRIVFTRHDRASFSIHTMLADGTEIADLTPPGFNDNDPDYLVDGRILFKTDRFSPSPQLRVAVMNEDGTGVTQLSFTDGVSDHDPVGDLSTALFERFPKETLYSEDPETPFLGWDLVEAALDGSGEQVLLSDGWVNWLPVVGPTGEYLVYLKNQGHTSCHIATRDGIDLGRLIPDQSQLHYVDWK